MPLKIVPRATLGTCAVGCRCLPYSDNTIIKTASNEARGQVHENYKVPDSHTNSNLCVMEEVTLDTNSLDESTASVFRILHYKQSPKSIYRYLSQYTTIFV